MFMYNNNVLFLILIFHFNYIYFGLAFDADYLYLLLNFFLLFIWFLTNIGLISKKKTLYHLRYDYYIFVFPYFIYFY